MASLEQVLYFRRHAFYGKWSEKVPKVHVTTQTIHNRWRFWGSLVGLCGFKGDNILGDYEIRKTRPAKPIETLCARCEAKRKELVKAQGRKW